MCNVQCSCGGRSAGEDETTRASACVGAAFARVDVPGARSGVESVLAVADGTLEYGNDEKAEAQEDDRHAGSSEDARLRRGATTPSRRYARLESTPDRRRVELWAHCISRLRHAGGGQGKRTYVRVLAHAASSPVMHGRYTHTPLAVVPCRTMVSSGLLAVRWRRRGKAGKWRKDARWELNAKTAAFQHLVLRSSAATRIDAGDAVARIRKVREKYRNRRANDVQTTASRLANPALDTRHDGREERSASADAPTQGVGRGRERGSGAYVESERVGRLCEVRASVCAPIQSRGKDGASAICDVDGGQERA